MRKMDRGDRPGATDVSMKDNSRTVAFLELARWSPWLVLVPTGEFQYPADGRGLRCLLSFCRCGTLKRACWSTRANTRTKIAQPCAQAMSAKCTGCFMSRLVQDDLKHGQGKFVWPDGQPWLFGVKIASCRRCPKSLFLRDMVPIDIVVSLL